MTRMCAAVTAAAFVVLGISPAQAAAQHDVYEQAYDDVSHLAAHENPCGDWGASLREERSGSYRIVMPSAGQVADEAHINGVVDGRLALVPDDPTRPAYTGTYREKVTGVLIGVDENGDDEMRVAHYRLRVPLTTPEGGRLVLTMSGKVTLDAEGRMRVSRDTNSCS